MSIFFTTDAKPCCKYCRHDLPGRSLSGYCPHCKHWYAVDNATVAPGRIRAVALLAKSRPAAFIKTPMVLHTLSALLIIVGNATIVILLGRMAMKALYRACGMSW